MKGASGTIAAGDIAARNVTTQAFGPLAAAVAAAVGTMDSTKETLRKNSMDGKKYCYSCGGSEWPIR